LFCDFVIVKDHERASV